MYTLLYTVKHNLTHFYTFSKEKSLLVIDRFTILSHYLYDIKRYKDLVSIYFKLYLYTYILHTTLVIFVFVDLLIVNDPLNICFIRYYYNLLL